MLLTYCLPARLPACLPCSDGVMDSLERFLLIASSDDVTQAIDFAALDQVAGNARTQVRLGGAVRRSGGAPGGWLCEGAGKRCRACSC